MPVEKSLSNSSGKPFRVIVFCILLLSSLLFAFALSQSRADTVQPAPPSASLREKPAADVLGTSETATQVREDARYLFQRAPVTWDMETIHYIFRWLAALPAKTPALFRFITEKSFSVALFSSIVLIILLCSVLYRFVGRQRIQRRVEAAALPVLDRVPAKVVPYIVFIFKIVVASLVPLLLLGVVTLAGNFGVLNETRFRLAGGLLGLWVTGSMGINLLRGLLTGEVLSVCPRYGRSLFGLLRLFMLYVLFVLGLTFVAEATRIPEDVLDFLEFVIHLSIVFASFFLLFKRRAFLSLLPGLPYKSYRAFVRFLERGYFALIVLTGAVGFLWCLGFDVFAEAFFRKTWAVAGVYVGVLSVHYFLQDALRRWSESKAGDDAALYFSNAVRSLLRYATLLTGALLVLHLFGLLGPIRHTMSFPIYTVGTASISLWSLVKAALVLVAFMYVSRLLQAYLDYKVYPSTGIETGLAYALNTLIKYVFLIIGILFALRFVGFDLRVLLVFAGTAGIGIGLGLKDIAASLISGFGIIFGRKIRKGDWIKIGDTVGMVSDIYLRSTKLRTRDNIEFIIPNTEFTTKTIVNYSLTSPLVRVHVPVGVSYGADPREVRKILLACVQQQPYAVQHEKPRVRFLEFADSSIDFELLVWTDIRRLSENEMRSRLYFVIFEALKAAGIQIPFPQRDIHVRSGPDLTEGRSRSGDAAPESG